ncbi:MAG: DUF3108 domain-containing protein [Gammaproteobacteria bacterium]|jgi:hypothetical protein|nr:DUF3108 domain-containing protein [Gammaproteobacteria bacterium]
MKLNYSRQLWSLGMAVWLPVTAAAGFADPLPFTADYRASYAGFSGDVRMELNRSTAADEYIFTVTTQARGLARLVRPGMATEEARFRVSDAQLVPLSYVIDDGTKDGDDDTVIAFDWDTGVAHSVYEQQEATLELTSAVHDRLTTDLLVMQSLGTGDALERFQIVEKNAVRDYELTYRGEETVEVPAGRFAAVKYLRQRVGSSRSTLIWFAPEVNYLPVKLQQLKRGKPVVTTVATEISLGRP